MNRIDRLFALPLTLQHRRRVRAQELAEQFEVSKRSIYRDLSALSQMGNPIASLPGERFELVEGYYVPLDGECQPERAGRRDDASAGGQSILIVKRRSDLLKSAGSGFDL